ncbi:MAG: hypothetical protein NTV70_12095 [Acidobacteria bacterium]|nr:hypothetical protein [Acidobacteriota bacterium]
MLARWRWIHQDCFFRRRYFLNARRRNRLRYDFGRCDSGWRGGSVLQRLWSGGCGLYRLGLNFGRWELGSCNLWKVRRGFEDGFGVNSGGFRSVTGGGCGGGVVQGIWNCGCGLYRLGLNFGLWELGSCNLRKVRRGFEDGLDVNIGGCRSVIGSGWRGGSVLQRLWSYGCGLYRFGLNFSLWELGSRVCIRNGHSWRRSVDDN